jgi:hypothetical protein
LLNDVLLNADLAREAGQHAPALTALKMLGGELFRAFTERKETVNLDIQVRSNAELKELMVKEYGERATDLIWQAWNSPKQIEGAVGPAEGHDIDVHGESLCSPAGEDERAVGALHDPQNRAVVLDAQVERPKVGDMAALAAESLARSRAPKLK